MNKYTVDIEDQKKFEELIESITEKLKSSELITEFNELISLTKKSYHKGLIKFLSEQSSGATSAIQYLFCENWVTVIEDGSELEIGIRNEPKNQKNLKFPIIKWYKLDVKNEKYLFYQAFKEASNLTYLELRESVVFNRTEYTKTEMITICFEAIMNSLRNSNLKKKSLERITHYKLTVITGLILKEIKIEGFKLVNDTVSEPNVSFKEIHNSLVSHTRKFKKKCDLWLCKR